MRLDIPSIREASGFALLAERLYLCCNVAPVTTSRSHTESNQWKPTCCGSARYPALRLTAGAETSSTTMCNWNCDLKRLFRILPNHKRDRQDPAGRRRCQVWMVASLADTIIDGQQPSAPHTHAVKPSQSSGLRRKSARSSYRKLI